MPKPSNRVPFELLLTALLLAGYVALRVAALSYFRDDLNRDPDAYLLLGRQIHSGHGLSSPGTNAPTAYRPPLYPLLVSPFSAPDQAAGRGALNLLLSLVTLAATWNTAKQLGLTIGPRLLACGLLALDPLSIRYLAFPMTETLCAALVACLLLILTARSHTFWQAAMLGIVFGLCVLSRPTFWIFAAVYLPLWGLLLLRQGSAEGREIRLSRLVSRGALVSAGVAVCVIPWVVRNSLQLHAPIVMTTHGGYTLLLGNNEAFYREVVDQPWGTIWDGSRGAGQGAWIDATLAQADRENVRGEVPLDHWMSRRAWATIARHPITFLRACLLKFCWFWNLGPQGPQAAGWSPLILWSVRGFYIGFWVLAVLGVIRAVQLLRVDPVLGRAWMAPIVLIISLSSAHLVYWSDARMRTPITPAIALLAGLGISPRAGRRPENAVAVEPSDRNPV